jgi:tetratricopeptide (TPR) repeat protein
LAGIYFDQKNLKAAEATYLRGLERIPNSVSLRAFLGNFYVADKRFEEAKQQYEAAYEKMPTADAIRNNLAILLINKFPSEDNFKKALDLVSGFSTSKEPNYLDTLGWAQYHMGNFPQAISYLQQAITIKSSSEYHYHLGMTFAKNNQPADAKKELLLATKDTTESPEWLPSAKKTLSTL